MYNIQVCPTDEPSWELRCWSAFYHSPSSFTTTFFSSFSFSSSSPSSSTISYSSSATFLRTRRRGPWNHKNINIKHIFENKIWVIYVI